MPFLVGIDVGGTFTDASAVSIEDNRVLTAKARSTPDDLVEGLEAALGLLADQARMTLSEFLGETVKFAHGTTQTSNVMFTWQGSAVGLLATRGFADEILIMRARGRVAGLSLADRRHLRTTDKPPQIVPRSMIEEVSERIDHRGKVLLPLSAEEAARVADAILKRDVEAIAVSLLWASENPTHELALESAIKERAPKIHVTLSHRIAPVLGEYERTSTSVVNAFVGPTLERYLERLAERLRELGLRVPLLVLHASGGVAHVAQTLPVNTIESGPAAGIVAVKSLSAARETPNVVATDVGGTTFKVGLIVDGKWSMARETIINQYSLLIPMIDLVSIGSGGGSIAWADQGRLRVGPQSAGAQPGPVCYGWGGVRPTVTDADLVLGFLNADRFLGGRIQLRKELAEEALLEHVATPLFGGDVVAAAAGVRVVVDAQMGDMVRKTTLERGYDLRTFTLMAYGGAGPLHAAAYARRLGVKEIVVPSGATAYSAYGAAASDIQHSLQRSVRSELLDDEPALAHAFGALERQARELVRRQGVGPNDTAVLRWGDMRYERQLHDVRVSIGPDTAAEILGLTLRKAFEERYVSLYGVGAVPDHADIRLLRIGLDVIGSIRKPQLTVASLGPEDPSFSRIDVRDVFWPGDGWVETPIYDGTQLHPGNRLSGPAIIEHPGTTIAVPRDAEAQVDRFQSTVITFAEDAE